VPDIGRARAVLIDEAIENHRDGRYASAISIALAQIVRALSLALCRVLLARGIRRRQGCATGAGASHSPKRSRQ
jgi:hypothetical protein